jgi:hypothetical protein
MISMSKGAYVVKAKGSRHVFGRHPAREAAIAQSRAIHLNAAFGSGKMAPRKKAKKTRARKSR